MRRVCRRLSRRQTNCCRRLSRRQTNCCRRLSRRQTNLCRRSLGALVVALAGVAAALFGEPTSATAAGAIAGTVVVKGRLAVRVAATADSAHVEFLKNKATVNVVCQVRGDARITGRVRTTDRWDRLTNGRYVSDAFVKRDTDVKVPSCAPTVMPTGPAAAYRTVGPLTSVLSLTGPAASYEQSKPEWTLPVPPTVIGGFRTVGRPDHDGVDLPHTRNTPIVAASAGTVVTVKCNTSGPSCDVDGSVNTRGCGWYVEVKHRDDIVTRYCHMVRQPEVSVGDQVVTGQLLGFVGTSGHSSGPHLHFEVHLGAKANHLNAVDPVPFMQFVGAPLRTP
jgi:murein DD-endopeptidase MepM/ murein hydrolase activator NlpD